MVHSLFQKRIAIQLQQNAFVQKMGPHGLTSMFSRYVTSHTGGKSVAILGILCSGHAEAVDTPVVVNLTGSVHIDGHAVMSIGTQYFSDKDSASMADQFDGHGIHDFGYRPQLAMAFWPISTTLFS